MIERVAGGYVVQPAGSHYKFFLVPSEVGGRLPESHWTPPKKARRKWHRGAAPKPLRTA